MKRYTLGFIFNKELSHVLLIKKQRSTWQKGKYNGIGGHIEEGEEPYECFIREVQEESGIELTKKEVECVGIIENNGDNPYTVDIFVLTFTNKETPTKYFTALFNM